MCKATKEGGQRCVGHATQAYVKAQSALTRLTSNKADRMEVGEAERQVDRARTDLAVTHRGVKMLAEEARDGALSPGDLLTSTMRGIALRGQYAGMKALAAQDNTEREDAKVSLRERRQALTDAIKRDYVVLPTAAAGLSATPMAMNPRAATTASAALIGTVAVRQMLRGHRTQAPKEKRTARDLDMHSEAAIQAYEEDPKLKAQALAEIDLALTPYGDTQGRSLDERNRRSQLIAQVREFADMSQMERHLAQDKTFDLIVPIPAR